MEYGISWSLYKDDLSKGLAHLQLNEEFVDMTLAAEGHLVKVHKNIVALASPYIKEMIQRTPCQHPVIFLNNVTHEVLKYLLEYIYTGEVQVPNNIMKSFTETAKLLCIKGIDQMWTLEADEQSNGFERDDAPVESSNQNEIISVPVDSPIQDDQLDSMTTSQVAAHIKISGKNMFEITPVTSIRNELQSMTNNTYTSEEFLESGSENLDQEMVEVYQNTENDYVLENNMNTDNQTKTTNIDNTQKTNEEGPVITINYNKDDNNDTVADINISEIVQSDKTIYSPITDMANTEEIKDIIKARALTPLYTISNRGAIQLMLNRYMYSCQYQACQGRKRRWRCLNYRNTHCKALVDTENETITNRSDCHNHPHHDSQILKKYKKFHIFTKIQDAEESVALDVKK